MSAPKTKLIAALFCCLASIAISVHVWLLIAHSGLWIVPVSLGAAILMSCSALSAVQKSRKMPSKSVVITTEEKRSEDLARKDRDSSLPLHAFTIDLEDYFHTDVASQTVNHDMWDQMPSRIESSVRRLLDLLDQNNTRATVFTLGWVAHKYPQLIREVSSRGHEIGCHSYHHRIVSRMTPQAFRADTQLSKEILEDVVGRPVIGYRAPNFSITPGTEWAFEILESLGFLYDSSVNPVRHKLYGNHGAPRFPFYIPKTGLLEIPIATWRIGRVNLPIGGGAYLRLLPYAYTQLGLAAHKSRPATMYVHPWEIDPYQPGVGKGWKSHIRQTGGTATMESKLSRLLTSARFVPIIEAYEDELHHSFSAVPAQRLHSVNLAQVV